MRIGIIGYGSFGKLLYKMLAPYAEVLVVDPKESVNSSNIKFIDIDEISRCNLIILAVNIEALDVVCASLADKVNQNTIVVDVCSSKTESMKITKKYLKGKCQILSTHPLFGPQSIGGEAQKKLVICDSDTPNRELIYGFLRSKLDVEIIEMTAKEHDKQMAWVHSLTFFVGRGLLEIDMPKSELRTHYYDKLLDLVELEKNHTMEMFNTVQQGNPYSGDVRQKFIKKLEEIDKKIKGENK